MAAKRRKAATLGTWLVRALIVIIVGGAVGAAGGVVGVRTLEPGKPEQPDSLQLMLDSLKGTNPKADARNSQRAADSLNAQQRIQRVIDSVERLRLLAAQPPAATDAPVDSPVVRPDAVTVPTVVGLEEGKARQRLLDAHLIVGAVEFEASTAPAGTVLRTSPAVGDAVRLNGSVILYLSNGRTP